MKDIGYELFIKGSLLLIISVLAKNNLFTKKNTGASHFGVDRSDLIKKVIDFTEENYAQKIYIDDMATLLGMNKFNFCRFFKKYTGMTPIEYLNLHRVNEAFKLLQSGKCNVTEAALQTGFENMSYFTKTLKKYKNTIPSKLMRSMV